MPDLPLSKTLDPADFDQLAEELAVVDRSFTRDAEQHPMRRWEYALALRAFTTWGGRATHRVVDVGGAGSPFWRMLENDNAIVIDPTINYPLERFLAHPHRPRLVDAVFCLSVLEHVDDLDRFLYHLSCLVAPGGLLVLTMDYCDSPEYRPTDQYHFHWMRQRIFNEHALARDVAEPLLDLQFTWLGPHDYTWHGPQVFDYTFASLALRKRA